MGKWTLAHTEALCSEKFHTALQKPLRQSGLKLEEFHEHFDPQDPVVQKLISALVNDIVRRKAFGKSTPASRVNERATEAASFISSRSNEIPGVRPRRSAHTTIRARRRTESVYPTDPAGTDSTFWRTWFHSSATDSADPTELGSPSSLNLYEAYTDGATPNDDSNDSEPRPLNESSAEYWWRAQSSRPASESALRSTRYPDIPSPPLLPTFSHSPMIQSSTRRERRHFFIENQLAARMRRAGDLDVHPTTLESSEPSRSTPSATEVESRATPSEPTIIEPALSSGDRLSVAPEGIIITRDGISPESPEPLRFASPHLTDIGRFSPVEHTYPSFTSLHPDLGTIHRSPSPIVVPTSTSFSESVWR